MKIFFEKIKFKNFLSVGDVEQEFDFQGNDFTVIVGTNGHGKSTIIDALCYVLYNKPFRKVNLGQLVNTFTKKKCLVEIYFSIGDNQYIVKRGQKPKVFEIYKDGELIEEDPSSKDYQTFLEEDILQVNFKTFKQINILGKATYVPFMNLTAQHRREVVEDLLDSQIYSQMQVLAKSYVKSITSEIKDIDTEIQVNQTKLETTKKLLEQRDSENKEQIKEIDNEISDYISDLKDLNKEKKIAEKQLESLKEELSEYKNSISDNIKDEEKELRSKINILKNKKKEFQETISNIKDIDKCTVCLQDVDENHKEHIVNDSQSKIDKIDSQFTTLEEKLSEKCTQISDIDEFQDKINRYEIEINNYENNIKTKKEWVESLTKKKKKLQEPKELPEDIDDIELINQNISSLTNKYDEKNRELELYKESVKVLGDDGIKAELINTYIPVINVCINDYLDKMDLFAQFHLNEQFEESIKSHYRDTFSYHSFSEGQKMRIDLAILMTWRHIAKLRNSTSTNLLIMDEILDSSMDQQGVSDFMGILREMSDAQHTFIISHNSDTIDGFDSVIKAVMNGNFTSYERI